jgi:enoyl-CoA hydratase
MTSIAKEKSEDGVLILRIDRPPVNALDVDTLNEMSDAFDEAAGDDTRAVVLTGTDKMLSAGADLVKVLAGNESYIDAGIDALTRNFRTLFEFPKPIVAAVNGHALAGGAVLTCGCDYRVMGKWAGEIGAIELTAGVPFPAWALELVRYAVKSEYFPEIIYFGQSYVPEVAVKKGLVDEVIADTLLMQRSIEVTHQLMKVPPRTFALTKRSMRAATSEAAEALMLFDDDVKEAWKSKEVHDAIKRQMAKLKEWDG